MRICLLWVALALDWGHLAIALVPSVRYGSTKRALSVRCRATRRGGAQRRSSRVGRRPRSTSNIEDANYIHKGRVKESQPDTLLEYVINVFGAKRTQAKKWLSLSAICVNLIPSKQFDQKLVVGDEVMVRSGHVRQEQSGIGRNGLPKSLRILYEDDDMIAVDKPADMLVVAKLGGDRGNSRNSGKDKSLQQHINTYLNKKWAKASAASTAAVGDGADVQAREVPSAQLPCWADPEASGIVLFAKTKATKAYLQSQWHTFGSTYEAVVYGKVLPREGAIETKMTRAPASRLHRRDGRDKTGTGTGTDAEHTADYGHDGDRRELRMRCEPWDTHEEGNDAAAALERPSGPEVRGAAPTPGGVSVAKSVVRSLRSTSTNPATTDAGGIGREGSGVFSLIEASLLTNVRDQLRAQLAHRGASIVGDFKYENGASAGNSTVDEATLLANEGQKRLYLHHKELRITRPRLQGDLSLRCDAPPLFEALLDTVERRNAARNTISGEGELGDTSSDGISGAVRAGGGGGGGGEGTRDGADEGASVPRRGVRVVALQDYLGEAPASHGKARQSRSAPPFTGTGTPQQAPRKATRRR